MQFKCNTGAKSETLVKKKVCYFFLINSLLQFTSKLNSKPYGYLINARRTNDLQWSDEISEHIETEYVIL